ncbi:MAG: hypothetical protein JWO63_3381, partial [Frankiales bacterium]|nr:hypothetical protein [Frankiales bacterium]
MASLVPVVGLSLGAAFVFAASTSLKHASAATAPDALSLQPRKIGAFLRATVSHRLWLMAIGCDVVALALQVSALHLGALSLVQPLLISGLLFALLFRRFTSHQAVSGRELCWALVLTTALAGFLLLASTRASSGADAGPDRLPAVLAGAVGFVLGAVCVEIGRRQRGRARAAAPLGITVGMIYAASAALL